MRWKILSEENYLDVLRGFLKLLQFHKLILAVKQSVALEEEWLLRKFKDQEKIILVPQALPLVLKKQAQAIRCAILQKSTLLHAL